MFHSERRSGDHRNRRRPFLPASPPVRRPFPRNTPHPRLAASEGRQPAPLCPTAPLIEERIHLIQPPHDYYPDLSIIRHPLRERPIATTTATLADEPHLIKALESEFRELYIEIVYLPTGDVVTTIELLSPINKTGKGQERYLQKQQQILNAETSLVEIDLLRAGKHTVAVPERRVKEVKGLRYIVSVRRAGQYGQYEVYFVPLDSRLPRCNIPLCAPDEDAVMDLPAVFNRTYDVSGYEDFIDYCERPPAPPLNNEETVWLEALLQEKRLRATKQ
ncbi:MAG: DUF4058 family protein [Chloroflexi bacterium]|nr:DUF4058 family protein [Chloroflexota bacterium]